MKDERLEEISDKIRRGVPVGLFEAIEAIEYQEQLRKKRRSFWRNLIDFFNKGRAG